MRCSHLTATSKAKDSGEPSDHCRLPARSRHPPLLVLPTGMGMVHPSRGLSGEPRHRINEPDFIKPEHTMSAIGG